MKCGPDGCPIVTFSDLNPAERRVKRKRTAVQMTERGFTQEQIARSLGVTHQMISVDLREFANDLQIKKHDKTATNPKGAGRPRGSGKGKSGRTHTRKTGEVQHQASVNAKPEDWERFKKIAEDQNTSAAALLGKIIAEPEITPDMLSLTAQQKLDAAIRQHMKKLGEEFHQRVNDRVREFIDTTILPDWKKKIDEAHKLYDKRKGLMVKDTFNTIRRALHPDSRNSISDKKLSEAFDAFMSLEKYLLDEKDSPTEFGAGLPRTYADWEAAKKKTSAERAAKRAANRSALRPR